LLLPISTISIHFFLSFPYILPQQIPISVHNMDLVMEEGEGLHRITEALSLHFRIQKLEDTSGDA
jgi:hypothetical protein